MLEILIYIHIIRTYTSNYLLLNHTNRIYKRNYPIKIMNRKYVAVAFFAVLLGAFFTFFGSLAAGLTVVGIFLILILSLIFLFKLGGVAHRSAKLSKAYLSDMSKGMNQIRDYTMIANRTMPEDELKLLNSQEETFQSLAHDEKAKFSELDKLKERLEQDREVVTNLLGSKGEVNSHITALIKAIEQEEELVKQQAGILKQIHTNKVQLQRIDQEENQVDKTLEHSKQLSPNKINSLMEQHKKLDEERKRKQLTYTKSLEKLRSNII